MTKKEFFDIYDPDKVDFYVEHGLNRMYAGSAPTLNAAALELGVDAVLDWTTGLFNKAVAFASPAEPMSPADMRVVVRKAKAVFGWMKTTEMMHFAHLFSMGRYGKFYGVPDGQTLMAALSAYAKDDHPRYCEEAMRAAAAESKAPHPHADWEVDDDARAESTTMAQSVVKALASPQAAACGEWRKEPWGCQMARAYFVDESLPTFPGDMPYAKRREWAVAAGFPEEKAAEWDRRRGDI